MTLLNNATPSSHAAMAWNGVVKHTIGRFVRGNIAARTIEFFYKKNKRNVTSELVQLLKFGVSDARPKYHQNLSLVSILV